MVLIRVTGTPEDQGEETEIHHTHCATPIDRGGDP